MQNVLLRYTNLDLPYYKYIPGNGKHPKERRCEHIPTINEQISGFSKESWNLSLRYLYAIDLFNEQYYWEMHEVLEHVWLELGRKSQIGQFLQGLIQLSIALLKKSQLNEIGMKRLKEKAIENLATQDGVFLGIEVENLIKDALEFIEGKTSKVPLIKLQSSDLIW